jgi:hypothetical protein
MRTFKGIPQSMACCVPLVVVCLPATVSIEMLRSAGNLRLGEPAEGGENLVHVTRYALRPRAVDLAFAPLHFCEDGARFFDVRFKPPIIQPALAAKLSAKGIAETRDVRIRSR